MDFHIFGQPPGGQIVTVVSCVPESGCIIILSLPVEPVSSNLSFASQNASGTPVLGFTATTRTHPLRSLFGCHLFSSSRLSPAGVSGDAGARLAILGPAYAYAYPYLF